MLDNVEKQLEVVEDEHRFVSKVIEGNMINSELLVSHEFVSRFPSITKKIKEANEGMEEALDDAKKHYDKYKSLVSDVKNDYFSRSADDLKLDMQKLAPRVAYLAQIVKDVIEEFSKQNEAVIYWTLQIMSILPCKYSLMMMVRLHISQKRIKNILKKS